MLRKENKRKKYWNSNEISLVNSIQKQNARSYLPTHNYIDKFKTKQMKLAQGTQISFTVAKLLKFYILHLSQMYA